MKHKLPPKYKYQHHWISHIILNYALLARTCIYLEALSGIHACPCDDGRVTSCENYIKRLFLFDIDCNKSLMWRLTPVDVWPESRF